jgi:hypothetical protein
VGLLPWYDAATAPPARWCGTTANPCDDDKIARTPDEFFARHWLLHHQRARANQMMASNCRCRQGSMVAAATRPPCTLRTPGRGTPTPMAKGGWALCLYSTAAESDQRGRGATDDSEFVSVSSREMRSSLLRARFSLMTSQTISR